MVPQCRLINFSLFGPSQVKHLHLRPLVREQGVSGESTNKERTSCDRKLQTATAARKWSAAQ